MTNKEIFLADLARRRKLYFYDHHKTSVAIQAFWEHISPQIVRAANCGKFNCYLDLGHFASDMAHLDRGIVFAQFTKKAASYGVQLIFNAENKVLASWPGSKNEP